MMLDLDNLDLELDDDFPTGPLDGGSSFENSITCSLSWNGNKSDDNSTPSKSKNNHNVSKKDASDPILKILESVEKEKKKENVTDIVRTSLNTSNVFNTSFSPRKLFENDKNKVIVSKDSGKRILTHRKFPGPAGLLPDKPLKDLTDVNVIVDSTMENVSAERQKESVILCSQTSSVFSEASFKKLASDFDLYKDNCPLNKYTVDWVKKRALKKTLCGKKIPFLAVVLHNLDHGTPDPVITLRDQTGEIYGTLHREVWSELGEKLQPGAALALRQVGVLITGIARKQVHLNVTNNNILNIYSYSDEETVETNYVNELNKSDLIKSVHEWQISVSSVEQKVPSNPFSTFGENGPYCKTNSSSKLMAASNKEASNASFHQQSRTSMRNISNSKNVEPKNCINFMASMEDDFSDFLSSFDEGDMNEKLLRGKDAEGDVNAERDNNIRKRKIDSEESNTTNKSFRSSFEKKVENQERRITLSQPLSQAENQIVEEVLDGIDFDDFDT